MPEPTIRPVHADDLAAILAVQAACYPPAMQEAGEVVLARMRAAGPSCVVAQDGAGVCGYLFAYPSRLGRITPLGAGFDPAPDADTLYLHDLALAPRALGRGLARRLVEHLLARARADGLAWSALVSVQDTTGFWGALGYRAHAGHDARAALATYPGAACYMALRLGERGTPAPGCRFPQASSQGGPAPDAARGATAHPGGAPLGAE